MQICQQTHSQNKLAKQTLNTDRFTQSACLTICLSVFIQCVSIHLFVLRVCLSNKNEKNTDRHTLNIQTDRQTHSKHSGRHILNSQTDILLTFRQKYSQNIDRHTLKTQTELLSTCRQRYSQHADRHTLNTNRQTLKKTEG